ncbi:hypothetical protein DOTSEDRAFT_71927 [Dothistroma septosporum NZE10]|uniref:Uncharacterized protein n=1 Tax=Dothistroma septosporum (strain NZE10 / CBS 128990) TaxID=675120 RepID=N1PPE4_DOTSN|nr:hypothetical protein DOTSEDRAFT_71927 [Dothistroma septosporum NZE10]
MGRLAKQPASFAGCPTATTSAPGLIAIPTASQGTDGIQVNYVPEKYHKNKSPDGSECCELRCCFCDGAYSISKRRFLSNAQGFGQHTETCHKGYLNGRGMTDREVIYRCKLRVLSLEAVQKMERSRKESVIEVKHVQGLPKDVRGEHTRHREPERPSKRGRKLAQRKCQEPILRDRRHDPPETDDSEG